MSFTDDDLKRLKEAIGRVNVTSFGITMTPDEWKALLARLEAHERLDQWLDHAPDCIRLMWEGGEPMEDGSYRTMFAGKWYQSKPRDETPKCDCGLDKCYEAWRKTCGL